MALLNLSSRIIHSVEQLKWHWSVFAVLFAGIVLVRNYLETITYYEVEATNLLAQAHYSLYYVALVAWLAVALSWATQTKITTTLKTLVVFLPVIWLCPITDLIALKWFETPQLLGYLSPINNGGWLENYLRFFGSHLGKSGPTIGYRIEVATVLLLLGVLLFTKTKSIVKSIAFSWVNYTIIFFFCCYPYVLRSLVDYSFSTQILNYYGVLIALAYPFLIYQTHKKALVHILQDSRWLRLFAFQLLFIIGLLYTAEPAQRITSLNAPTLILALISIAIAWQAAIFRNNYFDQIADSTNAPNRQTVVAEIGSNYIDLGLLATLSALGIAATVSLQQFIFTALFIGIYDVYSAPPFHLKKSTWFSKYPITIAVIACFLMGIHFFGWTHWPAEPLLFAAVFFPWALHFIDLKDLKGDELQGNITFAVRLGEKKAIRWLSLVFALTFLSTYFLIDSISYYIALLVIGACTTASLYAPKKWRDPLLLICILLAFIVFASATI